MDLRDLRLQQYEDPSRWIPQGNGVWVRLCGLRSSPTKSYRGFRDIMCSSSEITSTTFLIVTSFQTYAIQQ